MTKYYLYAEHAPDSIQQNKKTGFTISLEDWGSSPPELTPGDKVLLITAKGDVLDHIQPQLCSLEKADKKSLGFSIERFCLNPVPLDSARSILNRSLLKGPNEISSTEYETLVTLMGGTRITEQELLNHIKKYITARGYYFPEETIHNYHVCLKTRPFVILAGLSGTGKSKLSQLYAEAIAHNVQNGHYLRLAVRPSWNDDRFLLGYLNTITGEYVTEPAVEFVIRAEEDRDNLYFLGLDEMNLAHVEYYFSQFLSALEEENPADRRIYLFSQVTQDRLEAQGKEIDVNRIVLVPGNLLFTGTINVDETTQSISDKVIDRANTIEFFDVELDKTPQRQPAPDPIRISAATWQSYRTDQPVSTFRPQVIEINKILNKAALGLGYRVLREIELYIANSNGLLDPLAAFDLQVKQRVLPRVRGTQTILGALRELSTFMKQNNLPRSAARLEEMENRLKRDGYTSFWR